MNINALQLPKWPEPTKPNLPNREWKAPHNTWLNGNKPVSDLPGSKSAGEAEVTLLARHTQQGDFEPHTGDFLVPIFGRIQGQPDPANLFSTFEDALAGARALSVGSDKPAIGIVDNSIFGSQKPFELRELSTIQHSSVVDVHFELGEVASGGSMFWKPAPIIDARFGGESRDSFIIALVDGDATISQGRFPRR